MYTIKESRTKQMNLGQIKTEKFSRITRQILELVLTTSRQLKTLESHRYIKSNETLIIIFTTWPFEPQLTYYNLPNA